MSAALALPNAGWNGQTPLCKPYYEGARDPVNTDDTRLFAPGGKDEHMMSR